MEHRFIKEQFPLLNFFVKMYFAIKTSPHYPQNPLFRYSSIATFQLGQSPNVPGWL
jgi:hypothetical protein